MQYYTSLSQTELFTEQIGHVYVSRAFTEHGFTVYCTQETSVTVTSFITKLGRGNALKKCVGVTSRPSLISPADEAM